MGGHSFSMRERPARQPGDYDQLIEELVKLLPLAVLLVSMYARPQVEHWWWRVKTARDRSKVIEGLALQQVRKEISDMEHGRNTPDEDSAPR
jgi:hypothetical protein